jgi:organic hydroperoxide reductase OsmC/OhrA
MVEKTDTINQLMVSLDESQRQCRKLIANVNNVQTVEEKERLEKHVHQLKVSCCYVDG